jgi:hypothetical protein
VCRFTKIWNFQIFRILKFNHIFESCSNLKFVPIRIFVQIWNLFWFENCSNLKFVLIWKSFQFEICFAGKFVLIWNLSLFWNLFKFQNLFKIWNWSYLNLFTLIFCSDFEKEKKKRKKRKTKNEKRKDKRQKRVITSCYWAAAQLILSFTMGCVAGCSGRPGWRIGTPDK